MASAFTRGTRLLTTAPAKSPPNISMVVIGGVPPGPVCGGILRTGGFRSRSCSPNASSQVANSMGDVAGS